MLSVVAGIGKAAAGTKVLTGRRPARERPFPRTKRTVVLAVALLALFALAALIPASQVPSAEQSSTGTTDYQPGAAAPVSQPAATPQMSEREAIDAYGKLPLSFVANEGQMKEEAVRYYAQGAGYGFFFTKEGATLSFAEGKGCGGHALGLDFLGSTPTLRSQPESGFLGRSTTWLGTTRPSGSGGFKPTRSSSTGGCGPG